MTAAAALAGLPDTAAAATRSSSCRHHLLLLRFWWKMWRSAVAVAGSSAATRVAEVAEAASLVPWLVACFSLGVFS